MKLLWWSAADAVMARLETDGAMTHVHRAALRTLGRLERDRTDPRLRTRQFSTERYGQMRMTPIGVGHWHIFWMSGPEADEITIAMIGETVL